MLNLLSLMLLICFDQGYRDEPGWKQKILHSSPKIPFRFFLVKWIDPDLPLPQEEWKEKDPKGRKMEFGTTRVPGY